MKCKQSSPVYKNSEFNTWGVLFRRICRTLPHHSSVINSSKKGACVYTSLYHYKQITHVSSLAVHSFSWIILFLFMIAFVGTFTEDLGDWGSIPGWVIPKTQKMILDVSLLNSQHYKVQIKGKVKQFREGSGTAPPILSVVANEKEPLGRQLYNNLLSEYPSCQIRMKINLAVIKGQWQISTTQLYHVTCFQ